MAPDLERDEAAVTPDSIMIVPTRAAPGRDGDDRSGAILGLPGTGAFWGDSRPSVFPSPGPERRRGREEILRWLDPHGA